MTERELNIIKWMVVCVNEFARQFMLDLKTAFKYLYEYGGINFLHVHYEAEHTLSFDETVDDLRIICKNNGGGM